MKSESLTPSLFKLMILIPLILDNMIPSAANDDDHHRGAKRINIRQAVKESRNFKCEKPQSRAYKLENLLQNVRQNSGETATLPLYIVLQRCDGYSGCCMNPHSSCSPVESEIYYDEIEIDVWNLGSNMTRRWLRVEQHRKCSCKNTTDDLYRLELQQPNVILL